MVVPQRDSYPPVSKAVRANQSPNYQPFYNTRYSQYRTQVGINNTGYYFLDTVFTELTSVANSNSYAILCHVQDRSIRTASMEPKNLVDGRGADANSGTKESLSLLVASAI